MNIKPTDLINQAIRTQEAYADAIPTLKGLIKSSELVPCKIVINQLKKIIKDNKITPPQKVLALEIFQECMMLRNPYYLTYAQTKILDRLSILATKKQTDLFKDSNKSREFQQASDRFIQNLLTYIQIWGQQFGVTQSGEFTLYNAVYLKLKEKVVFPAIKAPAIKPISQSNRHEMARKSIKQKKNDKEIIELLENMIIIVEEMQDPYHDETGKELIENIRKMRAEIDELIQKAVANENNEDIEKLFQLNERIEQINNKIPSGKRDFNHDYPKKSRKTEEIKHHPAKQNENPINRVSTPSNVFENILDLDLSPSSNPLSQFNTVPVSQPFMLNQSENNKNKPGDLKSQQELFQLKQIIQEKDSIINELKLRNNDLENTLKQTISILRSKEKECEEYHCFKDEKKKQDSLEDLLLSPNKVNKKEENLEYHEPKSDNDNIFRLLCSENTAVLFDNDILQLGFQLVYDINVLKMNVYIGNKSKDPITKVTIDIENIIGFDIELRNSQFEKILPGKQANFEIINSFLIATHIYPRIKLECIHMTTNLAFSIKIPVNIAKFAENIVSNSENIWKEWDSMMFSSDISTGKCITYKNHIPKILQFSPNIIILTNNELSSKLDADEFLIAFKLKDLVLALISLNRNESTYNIETRSNNEEFRKSFLLLLISQVAN